MRSISRRWMVPVFAVMLMIAAAIAIPQAVFAADGSDGNEEGEVVAIEYLPVKEVVYYQGLETYPGWASQDGDHLIVTMEGGQKKDYLLSRDSDGLSLVCDETGERIFVDEEEPVIRYTSDQETVPWELGTFDEHPGNYVTVTYAGQTCKIPVTLKENPVQSISCTPAKPYKLAENVHGYQSEGFFEYDYPGWNYGDQVTIFFKDGTQKTYVYKYVSKKDRNLFVNKEDPDDTLFAWGQTSLEDTNDFRGIYLIIEQSEDNPLQLGNENHVTISCATATCQVPLEIVKNNVNSIKFTPKNAFVYVEDHGGYVEEERYDPETGVWVEEPTFVYEYGMDIQEGDSLEVTYNDGKGTRTYVAGKDGTFVDASNPEETLESLYNSDIPWIDGKQGDKPWKLGTDNTAYIKFRGLEDEIPVTVIPSSDAFETAYNAIAEVIDTIGSPKKTTAEHEELIRTAMAALEPLSDNERKATYRAFRYTLDQYIDALEEIGVTIDPEQDIRIDEEHFPDEVFRNYVGSQFDKDYDGILSESEADAVTEIKWKAVDELGDGYDETPALRVKDYTGLEYFSNLTKLICGVGEFEKFDVSHNQKLEYLDCGGAELTALDVSQNPELVHLNCDYNNIQSLDLSNNLKLQKLSCYYTDLQSLDVTKNTELEELTCSGYFSELDISKNTKLRLLNVESENLTALDVSTAPDLEYLDCLRCKIKELDTSGLKKLNYINASYNQLTELDLTACEDLYEIDCNGNKLTKLEIPENNHLVEIECYNNQLSELNVCGSTKLERLICNDNQLTSLPLDDLEKLKYFDCYGNQIKELYIGSCPLLINAYENGRMQEEDGIKKYSEIQTEDEEMDGEDPARIRCDSTVTISTDKLPPLPTRYLEESDIFWFSNGYRHFGYDDYFISDNDLQKLIKNVRKIYAQQPDFAESVINGIRKSKQTTWGGSCYGMAAVTILDKQNAIGFNENFDPAAATMHDVHSPSENEAVKSAINYYFLSQNVPYLRIKNNNRYDITKAGWTDGLQKLVTMSQEGSPIMFSYFWKAENGQMNGHAIVIKGYEKSGDGSHHLIAYDNRIPTRDMDVTVSSDYSSCVVNGNETATSVEFIQDMSAFETIDIDGPDNQYQSDAASGSTETASDSQGTNITVRANGKVSIENAEGKKLEIQDGQYSGNMDVSETSMIVTTTDTGEDRSMLSFNVSDSKTFTFQSNQKDMTASVQSEELYGSVETDGADKITISETNGVSVEGESYSYDMALSVNNSACNMVSVAGKTNEDANLKLVEGNVEATGIDDSTGTITVFSNDINTDTYTYDKGYSSIMIAPSDSEEAGQIEIKGSSNNDGNYDAVIGGSTEKTDLSDAVITILDQAFTGKPITPEKMVVTLGKTRLEYGKDFTALYENNLQVGTATIKITGTGKYSGTAQGTFKIIKAKNPAKISKKTITLKAKKLKKKSQVAAPLKITGAQGGTTFKAVKWNAKAKKALKLNKKTGKITVKKGTKKSTFKVKVLVTVKGNGSYLAEEKTVTVKIKIK